MISIVIDSDRGHCYEHFKKIKKNYEENWVRDMYFNVCVCDKFWAARNGEKWSFGLFRPNLPQLGLFHPDFVCKSSFRAISMIKTVILDQSQPISLILKIKSKIQKSEICTLHVYYSLKRKLDKYTTHSKIEFIVRWVKKLSTGRRAWGEWGNRPNFVLEV